MYSIIIAVITKIIAIMNTNTSMIIHKLLVKKFSSGVSKSNLFISCLSFKSKIISGVYTVKYTL